MDTLLKIPMPVFFLVHFALSEKNLVAAFKTYSKSYYDWGTLKDESWMENGKKLDYWYFYNARSQSCAKGILKMEKEIDGGFFIRKMGLFRKYSLKTTKKMDFA